MITETAVDDYLSIIVKNLTKVVDEDFCVIYA